MPALWGARDAPASGLAATRDAGNPQAGITHNAAMSTGTALIALGAFLASAVELVEALTIVLGVGTVRGWRSTLVGVGAATVVLALLIAVLGRALQHMPLNALRLVVGALPLVVGLQWLCKAIVRSGGCTGV